jgi:uncharacterized membrane protein
MTNLLKKILSKEDLRAIADCIGEQERSTSGEIRVAIRQRRGKKERGASIEQLARSEFQSLGMTKTENRSGVLLFLLIEDRQFQILADDGIHSKVDEQHWKTIAQEMSRHFSEKKFRDGILHGVRSVGAVLSKHVPKKSNDKNELPNTVHID